MANNGLWNTFDYLGVPYRDFIEHSQLSVNVRNQAILSAELYVKIWESYSHLVKNIEKSVIDMAKLFDPALYPPNILVAYHSYNYIECLKVISKYTKLCPPLKIDIDEGDEHITLTVSSSLDDRPLPTLLSGSTLTFLVEIGRRGLKEEVVPVAVHTTIKNNNEQQLGHYFKCPIIYDSLVNRVVLHKRTVTGLFHTYNEELLTLLTPPIDNQKQMLEAEDVLEVVRWYIKKNIVREDTSINLLAKELMLSVRSLQRKLKVAGTTYNKEVQQIKLTLAKTYLLETDLSNKEIAFLIGYSDENSFFRAFKKAEGTTISNWRQTH